MKTQEMQRLFCSLILLFVSFSDTLLSQTPEYTIRCIEQTDAFWTSGGLNDSSEVAGTSTRVYYDAFIWKNGVVTLLSVEACCVGGFAYSINDQGVVVGAASCECSPSVKPYRWANGSYLNLGDSVGGWAFSINSGGRITGGGYSADPYRSGVFIYDGSMWFPGINGTGRSINDSNSVVGEMSVSGTPVGFMYRDGSLTLLSPMWGAMDINNRNQVVGRGPTGALLWENGNTTILWPESAGGQPKSINDSGTVVGSISIVGPPFDAAVRWKNGVVSYLDSLIPQSSGVSLSQGIDINNKGEILCSGLDNGTGVWYYYLLTPSKGRITNPGKGNTWIAGEQDTIKWKDVWRGRSLLVEYSADSGRNFQVAALDVSGDSSHYEWDIPKDILSTKCFIRIRDNNTFDSLAVSERFKIKPYTITRLDDNGNYVAYDITTDRWGFGNDRADVWPASFYGSFDYRGTDPFTGLQYPQDAPYVFLTAQSKDFTDWISFVNAFGQGACYYLGSGTYYYKPEAILHWAAKKRKWGGSCFAIAGSNALAFEKKDEFRNKFSYFPNFATPISVTSEPGVIKSITELYAQVYGNPTVTHEINNWLSKTPNQTLNDLKEMLKTDSTRIRTISFWHKDSSWAHNVLPYKVERSTIVNTNWLVWVWDNSYPDDLTAFVYIDTLGNSNKGTWYYANWPNWGGPGKLILELESSTYLGTATLPMGPHQYSPFILSDTILQVITTYNADIAIKDNQGHITGYANSVLSDDIPGSVPMILPTGSKTPPYGYHLHTGDYAVVLNQFTADTIDTYFFTGNRIFSYGRYGAAQTQTDRLSFDGGVSLTNPDAEMKSIHLLNLSNDATNQKLAMIQSLALAQNDSVKFDCLGTGKYKLASFGTAKSYSLELQHVSDSGLVRFGRAALSLASNTTHIIEPNWDHLRDSLLTILVDVGNNGTIDDTLIVRNELPLPIQLVSFTATMVSQSRVRLDWTTLTEINNYGFEIQMSDSTQQHYQTIPNSFIPGHGTTNEPQHYSYIDSTVAAGVWCYRLKQIDLDGSFHYSDGVRVNLLTGVEEQQIPTVFSLSQNYPNPLNPSTTIRYALPQTSFVTLTVYNTLGQQVAQLVNEQQQAGYHDVVFRGDGLASGVYFYRIQAGDFIASKKLLLLK